MCGLLTVMITLAMRIGRAMSLSKLKFSSFAHSVVSISDTRNSRCRQQNHHGTLQKQDFIKKKSGVIFSIFFFFPLLQSNPNACIAFSLFSFFSFFSKE
jgi:hypothetical protein